MKLSIISTVLLAAGTLAAPSVLSVEYSAVEVRGLEARAGPVSEAINSIIGVLNTTVTSLTDDVQNLVVGIGGSLSASLRVIAQVNADFDKIGAAITNATLGITKATFGAIGGIVNAAKNLTQTEISNLVQVLAQVQEIINQVKIVAALSITNLFPAVGQLLQSEIGAISNVVSPLITPLVIFAQAVTSAQINGSANVTGLANAVNGLKTIVGNILNL